MRTSSGSAGIAMIAVGIISPSFGQVGPLFPTPHYDTLRTPSTLKAGDVDGDGRVDAVLPNRDTDDVTIMRGGGDGTFTVLAHHTVGDAPTDLVLADLDGDFVLDVVTTDTGSSTVSVLRGLGPMGGFAPAVSYPNDSVGGRIEPIDHDLDGDLDLLVAGKINPNTSLQLHTNDGAGGFTRKLVPTGFAIVAFRVCEVNADGRSDVVFLRWTTTGNITTYLGTPANWFAAAGNKAFSGYQGTDVDVADFDHDGDGDAAVVVWDHIAILRNDGVGSGGSYTLKHYVDGTGGNEIAAVDIAGDENVDLVTGGLGGAVLIGSGFATFAFQHFLVDANLGALVDVNGDLRLDVLSAPAPSNYPAVTTSMVVALQDSLGRFGGVSTAPLPHWHWPVLSDVDVDGDLDPMGVEFIGSTSAARIAVTKNDGTGAFAPTLLTTTPPSATGFEARGPIAADFDNDGIDDVVVWDRSGVVPIHHGRGLGNGTFGNWTTSAYPAGPATRYDYGEATDLDLDGNLDLVLRRTVNTTNKGQLRMMLGAGTGAFTPAAVVGAEFFTPHSARTFAVDELNGDGIPDLVSIDALTGGPGRVNVYTSTAPLQYGLPSSVSLGNTPPDFVDTADLDGDSVIDVVALHPTSYFSDARSLVSILANGGSGNLSLGSTIDVGAYTQSYVGMRLADFDSDGRADLATGYLYDHAFAIRSGDGALGFRTPNKFGAYLDSWGSFDVGDLDQNGRTDFIGSLGFDLRQWEPAQPCPGGFVEYGLGCFGHSYFALQLSGFGCASPGRVISLSIEGAFGGQPVFLRFGGGAANLPLGFGCSLFVWPLAPATFVLPTDGSGPGGGTSSVSWELPASTPTGVSIWMQAFSPDPGVLWGFASSNGLRVDVN